MGWIRQAGSRQAGKGRSRLRLAVMGTPSTAEYDAITPLSGCVPVCRSSLRHGASHVASMSLGGGAVSRLKRPSSGPSYTVKCFTPAATLSG